MKSMSHHMNCSTRANRRVAAGLCAILGLFLFSCSSGPSSRDKMAQIAVWEDQGWVAHGKLYDMLFDGDTDVRERAALALGRVNDTLALDTLRHALMNDDEPRVRAMAAFAMGIWQWKVSKDALLDAINLEEDATVLEMILLSLAKNYAREEYFEYIHLLRHPDPRVRAQCALTLDKVNQQAAVDSIVRLLDDPDPEVKRSAMFALARSRSRAATEWALGQCDDPDPRVRGLAYRLLASAPTPEVRARIVEGLSDPNPSVRGMVADAILALRDSTTMMNALPFLQTDPDARFVRRLTRAIGVHWQTGATPALQRLLEHPDPMVRKEATGSLCNRRDFDCLDLIEPSASDPDPRVRVAYLEALEQVGRYAQPDTSQGLPLVRRLLSDPNPTVRARALTTYGPLGQIDLMDYINKHYHDTARHVVINAIGLIGMMHIFDYADSLHGLYPQYKDDPSPEMKWAILASGANLLPSIEIDSMRQDLLDWGMADPSRLVRWYTIAVADKFRQDLRGGLGVYHTDLTVENIDSLLPTYSSPPQLRLNTTRGPVTIELDTKWAPRTARRMIAMAREGVYNDMPINEAQIGQMVQTGDRAGDASALPHQTVRDERSPLRAREGSVLWLAQTRDSGRGVFSILLRDQPYFDWRYPVVGRVVDGIETASALTVLDSIRTVDVIIPEV